MCHEPRSDVSNRAAVCGSGPASAMLICKGPVHDALGVKLASEPFVQCTLPNSCQTATLAVFFGETNNRCFQTRNKQQNFLR